MNAGAEYDTKTMEIEPEEGYEVRSRFGLARCGTAAGDRLVRLADVVRWLMASPRELPFIDAVEAICSRIDETTIQAVYRISSERYAVAAAKDSPWHKFFDSDEEQSWTFQKRCAANCVRDMRGDWCGDKHWMAKVLNDPEYAPNEYDPFSESLFDYWERKGGRDSGPSAGSYAIRFAMAHELWGWGRSVEAVALPDAAPAVPAIKAWDVTDWPSLVKYRLQFAHLIEQKRYQELPGWLPEHVVLLAGQLQQECAAGRKRGALGRLAKELSYVRGQRVSELLKDAGYDVNTGEKPKPKAKYWDTGTG